MNGTNPRSHGGFLAGNVIWRLAAEPVRRIKLVLESVKDHVLAPSRSHTVGCLPAYYVNELRLPSIPDLLLVPFWRAIARRTWRSSFARKGEKKASHKLLQGRGIKEQNTRREAGESATGQSHPVISPRAFSMSNISALLNTDRQATCMSHSHHHLHQGGTAFIIFSVLFACLLANWFEPSMEHGIVPDFTYQTGLPAFPPPA